MTSYLKFKQQMAVLDADDTEIESWITVRGNHIPIKKGQSKEEAVKSFLENKGGNSSSSKSESSGKIESSSQWKPDDKLNGWLKQYLPAVKQGYGWVDKNKVLLDIEEELGKDLSKDKEKLFDYMNKNGWKGILKNGKSDKGTSSKELSGKPVDLLSSWFIKTDVTWKELSEGLKKGKTIGDMIGNHDDDIVYRVAGELASLTGENQNDLYDKSNKNKTESKEDDSKLWEQAYKNTTQGASPDKTYGPTDLMSPDKIRDFHEKQEKEVQAEYERLKNGKSETKSSGEQWQPDDKLKSWLKEYLTDVKEGEGWVDKDKVLFDIEEVLGKDLSKNKNELFNYMEQNGWKNILKTESKAESKEDDSWGGSHPKFDKLTEEYMPDKGEADNELGEILRSINRVAYRYYNDGDRWNRGYGKETVNWAVNYLSKVSKKEGLPNDIADGLTDGLILLKGSKAKNKYGYEQGIKTLIQTLEHASESDLDTLSKMKKNTKKATDSWKRLWGKK